MTIKTKFDLGDKLFYIYFDGTNWKHNYKEKIVNSILITNRGCSYKLLDVYFDESYLFKTLKGAQKKVDKLNAKITA